MKSPRVYFCLLTFLCYILLAGCHKTDHKVANPPGPTATTTTVTLSTVSDTTCKAYPDPLPISSGDTVVFKPGDSKTYLVTFLPTSTPSGPVTLKAPFRVGGTSVTQIMQGPSDCLPTGAGCKYKYNLNYIVGTSTQQPPCADPVIHIKPQAVKDDKE